MHNEFITKEINVSSYPHTNNKLPIFPKFAAKIQSNNRELESCPNTPTQMHQNELMDEVTNLFYKTYKVPLFSIELGCCKMPKEDIIASLWRQNINKMLNFLNLLETGVKGFIKDTKGRPLRESLIKIEGNIDEYRVTKNQAHFRIVLPSGKMVILFSSPGYQTKRVDVLLNNDLITDLGDVILVEGNTTELENSMFDAASPTERNRPIFNSSDPMPLVNEKQQIMGSIEEPGVVNGFVLDTANHPLGNAKVFVERGNQSAFTDSLGVFKLTGVPTGDAMLIAEAPKHKIETK